ncbi:MAG TPA: flagellar biosynthetic protein FliO [Xanthobacteraceae bacterium]|nr:flagellar biosynthetic protein FliO [Xanthobacteraceae bacterium]
MFDTLFGAEVSPALKFFIAFVIVLALIGVTAWLVRRFGAERFGGSSARGRQPRLAVVDAASVDGRRRLVIIRRDNVEHLLMIGGPTDVVVEQNIVRAMGAPRDKAVEVTVGRGVSISEPLARPVPLGEGSMWPLQPQPESNGRAPRAVPEEPVQWTWPAHSESQRPSSRPEPRTEPRVEKPDTQTNLANELSPRPTPPRDLTRPVTPPTTSRSAPTLPAPAAAAVEKVEKTEKLSAAAGPDQNLAEMANRLEASLRRANEPRVSPEAPAKAEPAPPPAQRVTPPEPKPASSEAKPPEAKPKALYDSLEEEMASLLGRPPGKT